MSTWSLWHFIWHPVTKMFQLSMDVDQTKVDSASQLNMMEKMRTKQKVMTNDVRLLKRVVMIITSTFQCCGWLKHIPQGFCTNFTSGRHMIMHYVELVTKIVDCYPFFLWKKTRTYHYDVYILNIRQYDVICHRCSL